MGSQPIAGRSSDRRRYQRGQLTRDGDRWTARWRVDATLPKGALPKKGDTVLADGSILRRIRKFEVIASVKECPTKRLAQRKLDEFVHQANAKSLSLTVDRQTIRVVLCDGCRERLLAALGRDLSSSPPLP